ncbi:phosphopantetheine adenylyltransferase [bacterium BMS3Abin02]|nr:phosphopantetheine adenylyltransferase [bacterium BMS3Abin02]GBE23521.1 phosphopantetheine adenylyltransferase [bacterium BMS3Bbin01]HDH27208.1 pantetheine-phosphate adenylyltransferase [Actinomycetota bacterium]HDL48752.1 pantetheine-phosphate adenylyltransferase [Actinomycetota bacterium]
MTVALIPGSFDPPTNGHLDVIRRCLAVFGGVVIAVVANPSKTPLFDATERVAMLQRLYESEHVEVESFEGLLVDFARSRDVHVIVKGLRAVSDFEYELQMAQMNESLSGISTLFLPTAPVYGFLSSSLVKEVARFGGPVEELVPPIVNEALKKRYGND